MKKIVATILATAIVASPVYVSADNHSNKSKLGSSQSMFGQSMTGQNMMGQNTTGQNTTGQNMMGQNMTGQNMMGNNVMVQNIPQQTINTASRVGYGSVNSMASLPSTLAVSPFIKTLGYSVATAVFIGALVTATNTTSSHTASNH